jgi:inhibitor of growth protein 3
MAAPEDCASVLEQFIHDAANLPAEISHMMEEIQAKDAEMQKYQSSINSKDASLQKNIKVNGVLHAHPKEAEYAEQVNKNYELMFSLQNQKVQLSERACNILDRQIKRLDTRIRELASDGQLSADGLPSIFNRKAEKSFMDVNHNLPLQAASISALNASAHRINAQSVVGAPPPQRPSVQTVLTNAIPQRSSAPATPAAVQAQRQREREHSLGADNKRRKLGNPLAGANLPAQPSNLRQSSIGPGTPKAGTPTATTASRAGSVPRTSAAPQSATAAPKKSALSKKPLSNQQINKVKNKKHARLSSATRKKGQSPSVRGGRAGTAASEEDSGLTSADASETDASQSRARRGQKKKQQQQAVKEEVDVDMEEGEGGDDDMDDNDEGLYCYCQKQSYGEMVGCENGSCPYQWFHIGCINMKELPADDEDWYCPECRQKDEVKEKLRIKAPKIAKAATGRK